MFRAKKDYCQSTEFYSNLEDEIMRNENVRMRPFYNKDGLKQLAAAISLQAVIDYKCATLGMPLTGNYQPGYPSDEQARECEEFFHGEIFQHSVGGISVDAIKRMIRETPLKNLRRAIADAQRTEKEEESA